MSARSASLAFGAAARIVRVLTAVYLAVAGATFVLALALYSAEIVMRAFFNTGFPEYYEIVGTAFIWVFLLGAAAMYGRDQDIVIELVQRRLPGRAGAWLELLVHAAIVATMAVTAEAGWRLAEAQWNVPTPLLEISESIKFLPLVVASVSIALSSGVQAWSCAIGLQTGKRPPVWPHPFFDEESQPEQGGML